MAAQPVTQQRHLQIAPQPVAFATPRRRSAQQSLEKTGGVGLIELDIALTKLAISKKTSPPAIPIVTYKKVSDSAFQTSSPTGETTFFRWGQNNNKRSFVFNADGSAQYMVKMGETIISIVECLLREKHRMFTYYEPTYREIRAEVSSLRAANPEIADLDLLHTGQWVTIPALVVCEALTGQGRLSA